MNIILRMISIFVLIGCFSSVAHGSDKNKFPWLMTPYKHNHLTEKQKIIYLNAFFETLGFIGYSHTDDNDVKSVNELNTWMDCVMKTKGSKQWSPDYVWVFGKEIDKSAAYILYNDISPMVCEKITENKNNKIRTLSIYSYKDWNKWSIKDKSVYLSGYLDTAATIQMQLKNKGIENHLRELQIIIEATGIDGVLSDVMNIKFDKKSPLPWSISKGLGAARKRVYSE